MPGELLCPYKLDESKCQLTISILLDSSTVLCWTSPFVIFGVSGVFCRFYSFLMENPISEQCRP